MAYNDKEGLVDPFGGVSDLSKRIIRCVGNPLERFAEDPLRILRAVRFSAQLKFGICPETAEAIHHEKEAIKSVSQERIASEFCKILEGEESFPAIIYYKDVFSIIMPELKPTIRFDQKNPYHSYDVFYHTMLTLKGCRDGDLVTKLAAFFHDISKPRCAVPDNDDPNRLHFYENVEQSSTSVSPKGKLGIGEVSAKMTDEIMRRMKFDNKTRKAVTELVRHHDTAFEANEHCIRRWLNKIGPEQFERLLILRRADISAQNLAYLPERLDKIDAVRSLYEDMKKKEQCFSLKDLAVNGYDLLSIGYSGKELGNMLEILLQNVMSNELENEKDILLEFASSKTQEIEENER